MREEFELMGQEFHSRGRRMDEMLVVVRKLWQAGGYVEHHGEFYDFEPLEMRPLPSHPVPILVGGFSKAAKRRAATLGDGWISDLHTTQEIAVHVTEIRELRARGERAIEPFTVVAAASDAYTLDGYRRLEDAGVTHVQTLPWKIFGSAGETVEEKRAGVTRFGDEIISKLA